MLVVQGVTGGKGSLGHPVEHNCPLRRAGRMSGLAALEPDDEKDTIQVAIRCRPFLKEQGSHRVYDTSSQQLVPNQLAPTFKGEALEKKFDFDHVFEEILPQGNLTIHDDLTRPVVDSVLTGFHGTIICYGQTGSGKTHTMTGDEADPGLIQLSVQQIFDHISASTDAEYMVRVGYIELYNEKVRDLLNPGTKDLKIRHRFGPTSSIACSFIWSNRSSPSRSQLPGGQQRGDWVLHRVPGGHRDQLEPGHVAAREWEQRPAGRGDEYERAQFSIAHNLPSHRREHQENRERRGDRRLPGEL